MWARRTPSLTARAAAEELARLLVELNREERVTLMVATHALDLAEQMGRRFQLRDGRVAG